MRITSALIRNNKRKHDVVVVVVRREVERDKKEKPEIIVENQTASPRTRVAAKSNRESHEEAYLYYII